jgi:8-oxo-dGTP diphosphatase
MNSDFRLAVKGFVAKDGEVLLLRRRKNDSHKPDTWDIPGGRLELGEDPFEGLKREVMEETGLRVAVEIPLNVHHFVRDDGQKITMIIFLCSPLEHEVKLSQEHTEFLWANMEEEREKFPEWLSDALVNIERHGLLGQV